MVPIGAMERIHLEKVTGSTISRWLAFALVNAIAPKTGTKDEVKTMEVKAIHSMSSGTRVIC